MIELVMLVCLAGNPASCHEVGLAYSAENLTPYQCIMQAQPELAKWAVEHPGWNVARWTCRRAGRYAKT